MAKEIVKQEMKSMIKNFYGKDFSLWRLRIENALGTKQFFEATTEVYDVEDDDEAKKKEKFKIESEIY